MIRELKQENDRLKKELSDAGGPAKTIVAEDEESKAKLLLMKE